MHRRLITGLMAVLCLSVQAPTQAGQWVYTKIADTLTPTPQGSGGAYNYFGEAPAWNGGRVVFSGEGGLYEYDPATATSRFLIGIDRPIPGGDGIFQGGFGDVIADQGKLIFGGGGLNGQKGIYRYDQGALERIVDLNTPIPDGNGGFTNLDQFNAPAYTAEGGRIAFAARDLNSRWGIFLYDNGTISRVVDTTTAIPGGTGNFGLFQVPALRGEQLLFQGFGSNNQRGLYVADSGGIQLIAKSTDLSPGYPIPLPFLAFPYYGWQGETLTFASGSGNVYQSTNGLLVPQIDPLGSLPGLVVPNLFYLNAIHCLATDATGFAVTGFANSYDTGIWLSTGGVLEMVIGPGAVLDGVTIAGADGEPPDQFPDPFVRFAIGPQAVNGRSVVFHAAFEGTDSYRQGLYIATYVPEPAAWLLAGIGWLVACTWLRHQKGRFLGRRGLRATPERCLRAGGVLVCELCALATRRFATCLPLVLVGAAIHTSQVRAEWVYTKIADSFTPVPAGGGAFNRFGEAPAWNGERVVFSSEGVLFEYDPSTATTTYLTGINTPIPGGNGIFQAGFGGALVDQGKLVIRGGGLNGQKGVYRYDQGALERIVDLNTPIPDGNGGFTQFSQFNEQALAAEGGRIAIAGRDLNGRNAIFLYDHGAISRVVDTTIAIPGGTGTFGGFQAPALRGEQLLFMGSGSGNQLGMYVADSTGLHRIADRSFSTPGYPMPRPFDQFPYYAWEGATPTFVGFSGNGPNVYQLQDDALVPQFTPLGTLPGLLVPNLFYEIHGLASDATAFLVAGTANDTDTGIWLSRGGLIEKVIGPGDTFDGVTLSRNDDETPDPFPDPFIRLAIGPQALNGRSVVFHAAFEGTDSYRQGLYIATYVPEPAAWLLAVLGCLAWFALRSVDRARIVKRRALARTSRRPRIRVSLRHDTRAWATPTVRSIEALEGRELLSANLNELSWVSGAVGPTSNTKAAYSLAVNDTGTRL